MFVFAAELFTNSWPIVALSFFGILRTTAYCAALEFLLRTLLHNVATAMVSCDAWPAFAGNRWKLEKMQGINLRQMQWLLCLSVKPVNRCFRTVSDGQRLEVAAAELQLLF